MIKEKVGQNHHCLPLVLNKSVRVFFLRNHTSLNISSRANIDIYSRLKVPFSALNINFIEQAATLMNIAYCPITIFQIILRHQVDIGEERPQVSL